MSAIPPGLCQCGCGQTTPLAKSTSRKAGRVVGQPTRYLPGHAKSGRPVGAPCTVPGCDNPHESRGLCHGHYEWSRRNGGAIPAHQLLDNDLDRFLDKVTKLRSGHWIWTGATASGGRYGVATYEKRTQPAHRVAWQLFRGPLAGDEDVDHTCRKTLCVNPDHLEPVTHRENVLRGDAPSAINAAKTHCIRGHEFTPENTRISKAGGRTCLACWNSPEAREARRDATRRYRARKADAPAP